MTDHFGVARAFAAGEDGEEYAWGNSAAAAATVRNAHSGVRTSDTDVGVGHHSNAAAADGAEAEAGVGVVGVVAGVAGVAGAGGVEAGVSVGGVLAHKVAPGIDHRVACPLARAASIRYCGIVPETGAARTEAAASELGSWQERRFR